LRASTKLLFSRCYFFEKKNLKNETSQQNSWNRVKAATAAANPRSSIFSRILLSQQNMQDAFLSKKHLPLIAESRKTLKRAETVFFQK